MNERFLKLAEQATVQPDRVVGEYVSYTPSKEFSLEKFAELIVRECATIADQAEPYKANDLILKHFGVENA